MQCLEKRFKIAHRATNISNLLLILEVVESATGMDANNIDTTTQGSRSFTGINMFKSKRSELTRHVSRDLGCYATDGNSGSTPLPPDEEVDSILLQLEGGLFGTKNDAVKGNDNGIISSNNTGGRMESRSSYFPFQRKCKKEIDRSTSDQSMDPDQFLWSNGKHEHAPIPTK